MFTNAKDASPVMELAGDPRWELVERIISSATFAKTERLSSFLRCVCELAQTGQLKNINEQYIGTVVFGRSPDYDPGIDSIVRSHASRLRHRLQQYFEQEGLDEELLLTIPKGGYLPVFELRRGQESVSSFLDGTSVLPLGSLPEPELTAEEAAVDTVAALPGNDAPPRRWPMIGLMIGLVLSSAVAVVSTVTLWREHHAETGLAEAGGESTRLFWSNFFSTRDKTIVVNADSGLVILQGLTKRRVTLDSYLSGDYLEGLSGSPYPLEQTLNLAKRRYTAIVDLWIVNHIHRLKGVSLDRTDFVYSRDLRMDEIKEGNLVLLGTYESTPWVQLYEPAMNFYFQNDLTSGVFSIINRHPKPGEATKYDSASKDPNHTVYGVVAYRPSLSGSGKVLILEGQSMAGTQTASDFVFDDAYLLPFLHSIRRADGTIPYFELLLRSNSMSAQASRLEMIAYRVEER